MSDPLQVTAHDFRTIRIFDFDLPDTEIKALMAPASGSDERPLCKALGTTVLHEEFVEFFDVADLGDLGLAGYLRDGNDIPREQITAKQVDLDNIAGFVLLVFSEAFGGSAQTLRPSNGLKFIGAFHEEGPDWSAKPMHSDSAAPYSAAAPIASKAEARRARQIITTLLVAFTLVLSLVLLKVFL